MLGTNNNQQIVWRWSHDAYGVGSADVDSDKDGVPTDIVLRYPGQDSDDDVGLYYNWHRYYNPGTGRYISSDPIGLAGGENTYAYVGNDPLGSIDPLGLATQQEIDNALDTIRDFCSNNLSKNAHQCDL